VDLETEAIVSCHVTLADQDDTTTGLESLIFAEANLQLIDSERTVEEAVMDKGYNYYALLDLFSQCSIRTYITEKKHKNRKWVDKPESYEHPFSGNRRRVRSDKGKRLSRNRSELVERTFAQVCETEAGLRMWLQRLENVTKIHTLKCAVFSLGLLMRNIFGFAKPQKTAKRASLPRWRPLLS
jgi:transposase